MREDGPMRRTQRQATLLIVTLNLLMLFAATTAVLDLRRLNTPGGTGLRWLEAAVFGQCDDYLEYSIEDASRPDSRSRLQLCADLSEQGKDARTDALKIGLRLGEVSADRVHVTLTRDGREKEVVLHVVKRDGHWRVLRDAVTCSTATCA
jgi:hypothetical protein